MLLGVDGCRAGWLAIAAAGEGQDVAWQLHQDAEALVASTGWQLMAIDIPIGLPERGSRACDQEARSRLGERRSSVFPAPIRAVLQAEDHQQACRISRQLQGKGISCQSFNILAKIRSIDMLLQADRSLGERIHEVHPELIFEQWNGGQPMQHGKKTAQGKQERRQLVEGEFPGAWESIRRQYRRADVADDDILDALAALHTARRLQRGEALQLPTQAAKEFDATGMPMQISA
jgi:predicted RNase H-like nuclease